MKSQTAPRKFTGWHMTAILVAFFGVVIVVNFTMASFAIGTFGGTVVDNSYVASQKYNGWLADAAKQDALGWRSKVSLSPERLVQVSVEKDGKALEGVRATGTAEHPLGKAPSISLDFIGAGDGLLNSQTRLPAGRWNVILSLRSGADTYKLVETVQ
ncbi:MAG: FixH family protein [Sphingorhabdus sp.]